MLVETLFALVVAVVLPVRAWRRYRRGAPPAPAVRYVAETLLLTALLAWLLWRRGVPPAAIGLRPVSSRLLVDLAFCLTVVIGLDVWSVWRTTRQIRRAPPDRDGVFADAAEAHRRGTAAFVAVAVVGAIWEELCFRATVFLLVPATPEGRLAGLASGMLLFGAQHLRNGPRGLAYTSFFGLMFGLLYLATSDLLAVIVAHAAGNILTVVQWAPRIERVRRERQQARAPMFFG